MQSKLELTLPPVPESLIAVIPRWTERYRAKEKYVMPDFSEIPAPLTKLLSQAFEARPMDCPSRSPTATVSTMFFMDIRSGVCSPVLPQTAIPPCDLVDPYPA